MRKVETIVIGGGIAGLSAAARLARHGETVVLEAEAAPGVHSSGRSVAFSHFGLGDALVRGLTALSLDALRATPPDDRAPPAKVHPALHIARADEKAALDELEAAHREFADDFERLDGEAARALVPVLKTGGEGVVHALLHRGALKLDSDAMLQGHVRDLRAADGELVCNAPVEALRREGGRWIVDTPGASWSARTVVNAAGAWADAVARMAGVAPLGLAPLRRTVIQFRAPEGLDVARWPFTKTVGAGFYILPEGGARLLASAMDEGASEPCDAQAEELDVATAAHRVEQATTLTIRHIEHRWAGLRTFAPDCRPVAGFDPAAEGFFWLAGQGGFGLQTSPAMALAVEALALGLEWPEEFGRFGITAQMLTPDRFA